MGLRHIAIIISFAATTATTIIMKQFFGVNIFLFCVFVAHASTYTTSAVVGTWAEGGAPGEFDDIIVNHDWSSQNGGSGNFLGNCKGSITVNSGGYYKVWGALVVSNGGAIFLAAGGTMQVDGSLTINGNAGSITLNGAFTTLGATVNGAAVTGAGSWTWSGSFSNNGTINGDPDDPLSSPIDLSTLPVILTSFGIEKTGSNIVQLHWQTSSEINNEKFVLERSFDNVTFDVIGEVSGQGNSFSLINYSFADINAGVGINFYRLKQVDFDGIFEYSKVLAYTNECEGAFLKQISSDQIAAINLHKADFTWKIYGINGQEIYANYVTVNDPQLALISLADLDKGAYIVVLTSAKQRLSIAISL